MLSRTERPLTDGERDEVSRRLDRARRESATVLLKTGAASAGVCGTLGILTALVSDAPLAVVAGFWLTLTTVFTLWIGWPWRKLMREQVALLDDTLRTNRAVATRIQSGRVVEFEEVEDEGACYAFDLEHGRSLFVVGQEFYEDADFPNTDFSTVDLLGAGGLPVTTLLVKSGAKLEPERVVPAAVKDTLELPDHLTVVPAPLDRLEAALRPVR